MSMAASLNEKLQDLQARYDLLEKKANSLEQENLKLKRSNESNIANNTMKHTKEFWLTIDDKCMTDPDSVKLMIKNKKLTLNDQNQWGRTVMMIAAECGAYQLVQFCLVYMYIFFNHKHIHRKYLF